MKTQGQLALVLHAHLPYVRHPEHPHFLEEHWFFSALLECYLPLVQVLRRHVQGPARLTLSLSPTLLSLWQDPLLQRRFAAHLDRLDQLCQKEMQQHRGVRSHLATWYRNRFQALGEFYFQTLGGDLIQAFVQLQEQGVVQLMTTAATHGYLPLLRNHPPMVRAQLRIGRQVFQALTGQPPRGLWLPECGYFPGLESEIRGAGYAYSLLETHGIQQAQPRPPWDVYAPILWDGVALFGRDPFSARAVWSRETGYPANPWYREYHRDLGWESREDLKDYLPEGVAAAPTGIKYHRVTGASEPKAFYEPGTARRQARWDARHFLRQQRELAARFPPGARPPLIVAPYDAELFGHWWFEGPVFLDALLTLAQESGVQLVTLEDHLDTYGPASRCQPAMSSWGEGGDHRRWLRPETGWVYLALDQAAETLESLLPVFGPGRGTAREQRILRQAARTLLLAQSSDWTFHLGREAGDYASQRLRSLFARFAFLTQALREGWDPGERLEALEQLDALFPQLDLRHFAA